MTNTRILAIGLIASLAVPATTLADVPSRMPLQGVLRDNAGNAADGNFAATFTLYDAEVDGNAVWTETLDCQDGPESCVQVEAGIFQLQLGSVAPLDAGVFSAAAELWLAMAIEDDPDLPRRRLGSAGYALVAATATGVDCSGCIEVDALSDAARITLSEDALAAVSTAGYTTVASGLYYDDQSTTLGATNVQEAIEQLKTQVDAGGGDAQEGQGTVRNYVNQWDINGFGSASEHIHILNPSPPKVLLYLYADVSQNFSTGSNLQVAYDFAPNQYSKDLVAVAGEDVIQVGDPGVFNPGDHILLYQTVGTNGNGTGAGTWEINRVKSVEGGTVSLVKPVENTYISAGGDGGEAQAVVAASYNNLEVMSGGVIKPSASLTGLGEKGGLVYLRTQSLRVQSGGIITADGTSFANEQNLGSYQLADSECGASNPPYNTCHPSPYCSSGGSCGYNDCDCPGGGGGNKTAGSQSGTYSCSWPGQGGLAKGIDDPSVLTLGGSGSYGGCVHGLGGRGGGLVVIGANSIQVDQGGVIRSNGADGQSRAGGGAGGTLALFADTIAIEGTVETTGGDGNCSGNYCGGDGGEGWVHEMPTIPGIVNESYPKGVQIWVDGVNVTQSVGDPNGKGSPSYDAIAHEWGEDGLAPWETGVLDLTNVANWTLGDHLVEVKETGGAGGLLKAYIYVVHTFSKSAPPDNDSCASPTTLDLSTGEIVVSGTTEDIMGKTLATDQSNAVGCGGIGGPDVVYEIVLDERSLLNADLVAPFSAKLYLREATCADGDLVYCADSNMITNPIEAGTYFLFVDSDAALAKGNFALTVSATPAPLPDNDTCDSAMELIFGPTGSASHSGTTLYSLDQYKGLCPAALTGGPDVIYSFEAGTGQTLDVTLDATFDSILYVKTLGCDEGGIPLACSASGVLSIPGLAGGTYWLFVDGSQEKSWGSYDLTVSLE